MNAAKINRIATSIVKRDLDMSLKQRSLHCIYCGIIVGKEIAIGNNVEIEKYVMTGAGPVCKVCAQYWEVGDGIRPHDI